MEGRCVTRYIRKSPRKLREVVDMLRGRDVNEVLRLLSGLRKGAASSVEKSFMSAVANIQEKAKQQKTSVNLDSFYLAEARVDEGPVLKRHRPRAMGRATPVKKRSSHLTLVVREK
jgi:large subunit ribosomal protein L22